MKSYERVERTVPNVMDISQRLERAIPNVMDLCQRLERAVPNVMTKSACASGAWDEGDRHQAKHATKNMGGVRTLTSILSQFAHI